MELYLDTVFAKEVAVPSSRVYYPRWKIVLSFLLPDVLSFSFVVGVMYVITSQMSTTTPVFTLILPVLGVLVATFALSGLYYAVGMHPAQELRLVTTLTMVVFPVYVFAIILVGVNLANLTVGLVLTLLLTLAFVPLARAVTRVLYSQASWWGAPTVVLASRQAADAVVDTLERWPEIGLRPVAVLDDELDELVTEDRGLEMTRLAPMLATIHKIPYVIVAMPNLDHCELVDLLRRCSKFFRHVLVVPDLSSGMTTLWTTRQNRQGIIGYHVEHAFRKRGARFVKRVVDIVGALIAILLIWPLLALIGLLIKLDSPGPILYRQIRMTRDGKCFRVLKFRSMHVDADEKLKTILAGDPVLQAEYEQYHKLQNDPRITRVGKVIRRFSLDELPQLWNVLRGTLSLVGPRAYMPRELPYMRGMNHIILQNRPGITGLWQVSGRNQLSFEERLMMDVHYVLNWTPWLDLYILARTLPVVTKGQGAA